MQANHIIVISYIIRLIIFGTNSKIVHLVSISINILKIFIYKKKRLLMLLKDKNTHTKNLRNISIGDGL